MRRTSLFIILFLLFVTSAWAKNLYVSPTGSDSVTYANNDITHPWATWSKAYGDTSKVAGDTIYFRVGTYTISTVIDGRTVGKSGTSGAHFTYSNYPGEKVTVNVTSGEAFYWDRQYNDIIADAPGNIDFEGSSSTYTMILVGGNGDGSNCHFKNLKIKVGRGGDNTGCFLLQSSRCNYTLIEYCTLIGNATGTTNNSGVIHLNGGTSVGVKILHNDMSGPASPGSLHGINYKHLTGDTSLSTGAECAYNYIHSCQDSIYANPRYLNIHDNLLTCSIVLGDNGGGGQGSYNLINHNTVIGNMSWSANDDAHGNPHCTITNNIFTSIGTPLTGEVDDYNLYVSHAAIGANDIGNHAPTYVGGSDPILKYALAVGSYGYGNGSDSMNRGANIALVGLGGTSDTISPTITITSPATTPTPCTSNCTYNNGSTATITLSGTCSDDSTAGVISGTWENAANSTSGALTLGGGTPYTTWSKTGITLLTGVTNRITVHAYDTTGNSSSVYVDVSYTSADSTAPVCTITTNSGNAYDVGAATTVNLAGTATDAVGVTNTMTWVSDRGGSGSVTCSGCTGTSVTWSVTGITLYDGANVITVRTYDAANNQGTDSITVTTDIEPPPNNAPNTPVVTSVEANDTTLVTGSTVIFKDDLTSLTELWDVDMTGLNGIDTSVGHGGSATSAKMHWAVGDTDAGQFKVGFGRVPSWATSTHRNTEDFTDIYCRMYVLMDSVTQNMCKIGRMQIFADGAWGTQAAVGHLWGVLGSTRILLDPVSGVSGSTVVTSGWNDISDFTWLAAQTGGTAYYTSTYINRWTCIEYHMQLNTPGLSDGVLEEWIDGALDARTTGLNFRGSYATYGINGIGFEGSMNSPGADIAKNKWYDHIVVSTEPIGLARSPLNPLIYKTAFVDADSGNTQSAINAQVSTIANVTGLVWDGTLNGTGNTIAVDAINGTFSAELLGASSLTGDTTYYSRVRVSDGTAYSAWSGWYPLKTIYGEPPTPPTSVPTSVPTIGIGGFRTW